uniref:Small vasohibin-binding protein n=1 Tax=Canis lupus familiaris TaxID=9615 RepID=A0A8C0SYZ2_CANLF
MDPPARKEKSKVKEPVSRVEKAKQKSAQQELKQRQRAEIHPSTSFLNRGGASFNVFVAKYQLPIFFPPFFFF